MFDSNFYRDKKVLITGHTGFVGSWMSHTLLGLGAHVSGYALAPVEGPNLFTICDLSKKVDSYIGDIRDEKAVNETVQAINPEIIFHLAAQPLVRRSYQEPKYTYETNVMGTVNLMESIRRLSQGTLSVVNVTTDKVYRNNEASIGFVEGDALNGYDPYSNSKSCAELVTHCYKNSYFDAMGIAVSTARAGNIIGGGDFAKDRILPDCVRATQKKEPISVRNPHSIRPYQHVLESIFAYLLIAQKQYNHLEYSGCYNIGPDEKDCRLTREIANLFCKYWGDGQSWETKQEQVQSHEATYLKLNCTKMKETFGWSPRWDVEIAIAKTVEWFKVYASDGNVLETMDGQIKDFFKE